jgi:hypothetical protein
VDRDPGTGHHLLGAEGKIVGACGRADLDQDLPTVAKVNKVFTFGLTEHVTISWMHPRTNIGRRRYDSYTTGETDEIECTDAGRGALRSSQKPN